MQPETTPRSFLPNPKQRLALGLAVLFILGAAAVAWNFAFSHSPVPRSLQAQVSFPVYFPVNQKLPDGYALENNSFRMAQPGVIIFSIGHTGGQRLIVSEEDQPASSIMNDFLKNYIPLRTTLGTSLGSAQVGAYGNPPNIRTVVSLTISKGPWLIVTAPANTSQADLKAIIGTFRK